jgi:hypothetical protein
MDLLVHQQSKNVEARSDDHNGEKGHPNIVNVDGQDNHSDDDGPGAESQR